MPYKDKPLKLRNFMSLKITHLKYYGNGISLTYSFRPLIPPSLKRLFKGVGLRPVKTPCGASYVNSFRIEYWSLSRSDSVCSLKFVFRPRKAKIPYFHSITVLDTKKHQKSKNFEIFEISKVSAFSQYTHLWVYL